MPKTSTPLERLEFNIVEHSNGRGHYKERHTTRLVNSWSVSNCTISAQSYEDKYPTTKHQLVVLIGRKIRKELGPSIHGVPPPASAVRKPGTPR